jgi:sortase B
MKTRRSGWSIAAKTTDVANRVLDILIALIIIIALLFSGYSIYDTWNVYNKGSNSDLLKYKPGSGEDALSFSELQAINPEVCAWLTVDDTKIDYPIVQGTNNLDYLNKDVFGEFSLTGSLFLDYRCDNGFTDPYSLIYGHHIEGDIMFGQLTEFMEEDFFNSHQTGEIFSDDFYCQVDWFACVYTDAFDAVIFNPTAHQSKSDMDSLLAYVKENSKQYREIGVKNSDQLIALSTCETASTAARVILVGRMTPQESNPN